MALYLPIFSGSFHPSGCILSPTLQFFCKEQLSRPTANSITINICANKAVDIYYEYGIDSLNYINQTSVTSSLDSVPNVVVISNLNANTEYFYRMRYRQTGTTNYLTRSSHSFHTQRATGSTFSFAIEADPHMDANTTPASLALTLQNMLSKKPDFLIDLGDNFMSEKLAVPSQDSITYRHLLLRKYYDLACHSIPLYLVLGNHEGELGWLIDSTATNLPVMASNTRKKYYQNPLPDSFYSGNTKSEKYVGLRQNYYSWEWGDALFIVLDIYWYTKSKPDWGWSLGVEQYNWFKNVISISKAKYKFVFCHQLIGGNGVDGRGGVEFADYFEMGGENTDGSLGFNTYRPGWGDPIHQLMQTNNASIYFHGHDHCFAKQAKDGIVYQEVPQPSSRNITNFTGTQYGYVNGILLPSRGFLLVTVSDTSTKVDYVKTYLPNEENGTRKNGSVAYTYSIKSFASSGIKANVIPKTESLEQNYPNPFKQQTAINYELTEKNFVSLKVYDFMGREIATLVNQYQQQGKYSVNFNSEKLCLGNGIYYYKLIAGHYSKSMKMICVE